MTIRNIITENIVLPFSDLLLGQSVYKHLKFLQKSQWWSKEKLKDYQNKKLRVLMTNGDVHGEGISNSIMEYMALGKPVIASDSGGTSEIIQNNKTGFVISNKSDVELEKKIMCLLKKKNMRETMGELGKQRVIEKFGIETMTNSFVSLYKEVLK